MALGFAITPDQRRAFEADQWAQPHLDALADDWERQALERLNNEVAPPAPVQPPTPSDSLTNPLGMQGSSAEVQTDTAVPPAPSPAETAFPTQPTSALPAPELGQPSIGPSQNGSVPIVPNPTQLPEPNAPPPTDFGPVPRASTQRPGLAPPAAPVPAPALSTPLPTGNLVDYARQAAIKANIDPDLFVRQINQESGFIPGRVSPAGARGIAQIVPRWHPNVNPDDPTASLDYAADLMSSLIKQYGDVRTALVAYNGGGGAVQALKAGTPYAESVDYVNKIFSGGGTAAPSTQDPDKIAALKSGDWQTIANAQLGKPYIWGSSGGRQDFSQDAAGFDCSGFVAYVWKNGLGLNLPAFTGDIQKATQAISADQAQPGDLVMLMNSADPTKQHVGIYIGNGQMINSTGGGVQVGSVWPGMEFRRDPRMADRPTGNLDVLQNAYETGAQRPATPEEESRGDQIRKSLAPSPDETISNPFGEAFRQVGAVKDQIGGAIGAKVAGVQSPDTGNPVVDALGTGASALGTAASTVGEGVRNITPTSELARGATGMEQIVTENRGLFDQQQRLVDEFAGAQARGDEAAMQRIRGEMDTLQAQLPDARNRDVLHAAAERNPSTGLIETGANLAGAAFAAPLVAEGAPIAARAVASAIDPLTGLPALAGRAIEAAEPVLKARQRGEGINPFDPPPLGGKRLSDEEVTTALETLAKQWTDFDNQAAQLEAQSATAFNPGLKTRLANETERVRTQQTDIVGRADYLMQHGTLPVANSASQGGNANQTLLNMYGRVKTAPPSAIPSQAEEARRFLVRKWTDRGVDLAEFQKDAERAAGRPLTADEMAYEMRRLNPSGSAQILVQNQLKPAVQGVGEDADWLKVYLTHQDNIDVGAAMGNPNRAFSGGLSAADSQAGLRDMAQQLGPERMAKIEQAADQIWDYGKTLLQRKVDSGLISQELFDELTTKYPHYSPTRIADYLKDSANIPSGRKISVQSSGLKRNTVEGTTRQREDPLASFVRLADETEALATKNEVAQAFLKLRDLTPDGNLMIRQVADDVTTPRGFEKMKVFTDGTPTTYMMPDYIARAIREEPVAPIPILTPMMNLFRALATQRNPVFLASNALNDAATYTLRSSSRLGGPQNAPKVVGELIKAYGDTFQGLFSGEYRGAGTQRYIGGGGAMSGFFSRRPEDAAKVAAELQRSHVFEIRSGHALEDVKRLIGQALTLKPVEAIGERIELAPRVAAMRLAERAGASETQAVLAGRTVTIDFSQGGTWAKTLNQVIPFFNVAVQSGTQIPRAFAENPKGFAATALTMLAAPTVAIEAWNRSDQQRAKDYEDVPQYVKDAGMVFMLPTTPQTDEKGNRKPQYLFFPTREFSPFVVLTREAAGRAMGADPRGWSELLMGAGKSVSPIQGESGAEAISTFVPLGVSTGMQLATNRDWFRNRDIVSQQADEQASALSQTIAEALKKMGVEARPSAVEFGIRDVGAGVGGSILAASDMVAGKARRDERIQSTPGAGGLIGRFVQDRTGERLGRAIDQPVPVDIERALKESGVAVPTIPSTISVRSQMAGSNSPPIALHQDERAEYQRLMAERLSERLRPIITDANWTRRPIANRNQLLETQVKLAREYAEGRVYAAMAADDRQRRMQAGRLTQQPKPKP